MTIVATIVGILAVQVLVRENIEINATEAARSTIRQFQAFRSYYARHVVSKIVANSQLKVDLNHAGNPDTIPLPATLMHDLGALLEEDGVNVRLYSPYPFPGQEGRTLDSFQGKAWKILEAKPDHILIERENRENASFVRVAVADRMEDETCVTCHNNHPLTPKKGWKVDDIRGVLEVVVDITHPVTQGRDLVTALVLGIIVVALLVCGFIVF